MEILKITWWYQTTFRKKSELYGVIFSFGKYKKQVRYQMHELIVSFVLQDYYIFFEYWLGANVRTPLLAIPVQTNWLFEIPDRLCISFGTRKPHSTTKHAIEKQTELAQAAFIYCNDTKNILSMTEKKPNKNLRSTFA